VLNSNWEADERRLFQSFLKVILKRDVGFVSDLLSWQETKQINVQLDVTNKEKQQDLTCRFDVPASRNILDSVGFDMLRSWFT
jgi:hypothetical protein